MSTQTFKVLNGKAKKGEKVVVLEAGKIYGGVTNEGIALRVYLNSKNDLNEATKNCILKIKKTYRRMEGMILAIEYKVFHNNTQIGSELISAI